MIPEILKLKGFLSYKNEETLDFTKFHVALISGENGQGLVLYKGEYVFGGGTIKEVFRNISNK